MTYPKKAAAAKAKPVSKVIFSFAYFLSTMKFDDMFAKEHMDRWTKAWNDHDVTEILSLYSEDISFRSPKIALLYPDRTSARISNKRDLGEYFSLGLKKFTPCDFFEVEVIIEYYGTPDNKIHWSVIEEFEFNDDGLIEKSSYTMALKTNLTNSPIYRQLLCIALVQINPSSNTGRREVTSVTNFYRVVIRIQVLGFDSI